MWRWAARIGVVIGLALAPAVVIHAGPARAVDPVPVDQRITTLDDARLYLPNESYNQLVAHLNNEDCVNGGCNEIDSPLIESLVALVGGTPDQVTLGQKVASKGCKTGYGCVAALAAALGLVAVGSQYETWVPWVQQKFDPSEPFPAPVWYARTTAETVGCADVRQPTEYGPIYWGETLSPWYVRCTATGIQQVGMVWGVDAVSLGGEGTPAGTWLHWGGSHNQLVGDWGGAGQVQDYPLNIWGSRNPNNWELRRVHLVGNGPNAHGTAVADKGFYAGYEPAPAEGDVESLTRCQRPDQSVYDVVTVEPAGSGLTGVPGCNTGDTPVYTQVTTIAPDGTRQVQSSQKLDNTAAAESAFPSCATVGCIWSVKVNGTTCADGMAACVEWATDKNSATCWYGPYQMPLSQCYWLERAYEFGGVQMPATKPNTDGDPATWDGPTPQLQPSVGPSPSVTGTSQPSPTTTGSPGATPTSEPSTSPQPTATGSPTSTTSASTQPSASPSPSSTSSPGTPPDTGPGSSGSPQPSDAVGNRCWPSGWGWFNPSEWVLRPIGCAFIPQPETVTSVQQSIASNVGQSGAADLVVAVQAPFDAMSSGSGCGGIEFDLPISGQTFHGSILNACSGPMATAAQVSTWLISLSVIMSGGLSLLRLAGAGFGYNVRVSDGD